MNTNNPASGRPASPSSSPSGDVDKAKDRMRAETGSASAAASQAADAVTREASAIGKETRQFAEGQADKVKEATATHLDVFADALTAARDELRENHSGPAAEMVSHAATGLESLSRSLHGKSTGELMDTVRQFGRDNPMGFLAGSLLAGFALSRFATAGMSSGDASTDERKPAGGGAVSQPSMRPQQPPAATPAAQQGGSPR